MQLSEVLTIDMLPQRFRNDKTMQGMAAVCDMLLQRIRNPSFTLPVWARMDEQPEEILDEMAAALGLGWYDRGAALTQKRAIIKSVNKVFKELGTPAAVKQVAQDYFGVATVEEWWEYGGDPGHFRIKIQAQSITEDQLEAFSRILRWVKRASAHLDSIVAEEPVTGTLHVGGAYHEAAADKLRGED